MVVDECFVGLEPPEEAGEVAIRSAGKQIQVALQHASHEKGAVKAVDNVEEVESHKGLTDEPSLGCRSRESERCHENDHGTAHFEWDRPQVRVIRDPRGSLLEEKAKVLELDIPVPPLLADGGLGRAVEVPVPEHMPRRDIDEGGHDERDEEPEPSTEESRRQVVAQLGQLAGLDELERLHREHVARDDVEAAHSKVAAGEEVSDAEKGRKVVLAPPPKRILK